MTMGSHLVADLNSVDFYARKAELEIALLSLDHSTEFYWAAACHYIYLHYVSDGDNYKAGYYLAKVNYYFNSQKEKPSPNKYFHLLEFHSSVVASRFNEEANTFQSLMKGMSSMFYHYSNRKIEDTLLPGTWEYCMNTKLCQQNYILFKQVSEFIFKNLAHFKLHTMKTLTDCHSEGFFKSQRLLALFVAEGYTILFMKQIPEISYSVLEEACLKVTLLTENEVFPFVLLAAIYIIVEAAQFHLEACKQIERGLKPRKATVFTSAGKVITFDYFSILEKDLRALHVLGQRYRRVSASHSDLMLEISQILERNNNVDMSPPVFSSSKFTPPLQSIPQQDEVLARQLEEQHNVSKSEDTESFLSDQSLGPWEELFKD
ncbi:predicted protein [Naegleria gruberi]|uniref:Predicted protein n=1 Tax=Naegleria gruberi TaxID=5762 RepID=D2VW00_NAEGR|nr:uncharacterized protein NAEGRDRAFT_73199 [Naegleria gruberi]EFC38929.1 predicted protein [Naegleria gruberi]|eukprot:XP_002671673.1 predicted protein [Naegleria gruberi strain NEG-M]